MKKYASFALYAFSIAIAVVIGMSQVGKTYDAVNIGGIDYGCVYRGYTPPYEFLCSREIHMSPGCTQGFFQLVWEGGSSHRIKHFLFVPTYTTLGDCRGTAWCQTPQTYSLTTQWCK